MSFRRKWNGLQEIWPGYIKAPKPIGIAVISAAYDEIFALF
jgi:hypothetical protein